MALNKQDSDFLWGKKKKGCRGCRDKKKKNCIISAFSQVFSGNVKRTLFMDPKESATTPSRSQEGNSENLREPYV